MDLRFRHPVYYTPAIDQWIDDILVDMDNEYENIDNFRIAELTSQDELKEYYAAQENGCCGSVDIERQHPESGRRFLIGFNHGH
jgi:hypothetical protein